MDTSLTHPVKKTGAIFLSMGVTGLSITIVLNMVALWIVKRSAAVLFSTAWWSAWFPSYCLWSTFLFIAVALIAKSRMDARAQSRSS